MSTDVIRLLKSLFIFICISTLLGCATSVNTSSKKPIGLNIKKLDRINVIYLDTMDKASYISKGSTVLPYHFTVETRTTFAVETLKAIPTEFDAHGVKASIAVYKSKDNSKIDPKEIARIFPKTQSDPLLVISPISISTECTNNCYYDMHLVSKLLNIQNQELLWLSDTRVETNLLDRAKIIISTSANARKFVKNTVQKMKDDGLL